MNFVKISGTPFFTEQWSNASNLNNIHGANQQEIKYLTEKQTSKSLKLEPVLKFTFVKYQK